MNESEDEHIQRPDCGDEDGIEQRADTSPSVDVPPLFSVTDRVTFHPTTEAPAQEALSGSPAVVGFISQTNFDAVPLLSSQSSDQGNVELRRTFSWLRFLRMVWEKLWGALAGAGRGRGGIGYGDGTGDNYDTGSG